MRHGHRDRRARVSDPAGLESHRVTRRLVTPVRPVFSVAGPRPGTLAHKWHSGSPESQSPGRLYVPTLARNHQSQDHVHHDPRKQPSRPIAGGCGHGPNKRAVTRNNEREEESRMSDILRFVQDLALGGTSGVIAKTACAPLERIKIILQVQSANTSGVKVGDRTDRIEATDLLPALC